MQYLVKTKGILDSGKNVEKTYSVMAKTEEEAKKKAIEEFVAENDNKVTDIYTSKPREILIKTLLSLILMSIAIFFALKKYPRIFLGIRFGLKHNELTMPGGIVACIFYSLLIIRYKGINNMFKNALDCISYAVVLMMFSCIFSLIDSKGVCGIGPLVILAICAIFSLLGIKKISGVCLIIGIIASMVSIDSASDIMGQSAIIFVLCGYTGLLLYVMVEPCIADFLPDFSKKTKATIEYLKEDAKVGMETIEEIADKVNDSDALKAIKNGTIKGIKGIINKIKE